MLSDSQLPVAQAPKDQRFWLHRHQYSYTCPTHIHTNVKNKYKTLKYFNGKIHSDRLWKQIHKKRQGKAGEREIVIEGELRDASVDGSPKRLLLLNMTISKDTSRKQKVLTILFIS